ncbi:IS66 family insertion sequence element accessory protein TnpB [Bacteroides fragilis]|nr:IS66 family insertion sequence element accessory protein TnpB [Bacteroides fragilis]MCS2877853.1 IS66 family insertion sequence element accessory protein TnpB [Bacteroides fragilis]
MFSLNESNRYYLYPYPTDMRKSFYTLSGIVTNQMGKNVRDGDAFIFINANCTCMKILHMEYGGLVIYHMKLEQGHFHLPVINTEEGRIKAIETVSIRPRACFFPLFSFLPLWLHYNLNPLCVQY